VFVHVSRERDSTSAGKE